MLVRMARALQMMRNESVGSRLSSNIIHTREQSAEFQAYKQQRDQLVAKHENLIRLDCTVPTLGFNVDKILAQAGEFRSPVLLLPSPLSPSGRGFTARELRALHSWLTVGEERLLVLDSVYSFDQSKGDPDTERLWQALYATDRVVQMYSISKTWLAPLTFGVARAPQRLAGPIQELSSAVSPELLATAALRMQAQPDLPIQLQQRFQSQWSLLSTLLQPGTSWTPPATGYFSVYPLSYKRLLEKGLLAVPPSLFGSDRTDVSIISCLHDIAPMDAGQPVPWHSSVAPSSSSSSSSSPPLGSQSSEEDSSPHELYHCVPLSNFVRGFDKYSRRYSKAAIKQSSYPGRFFVLQQDELGVGLAKASKLVAKLAKPDDEPLVIKTSLQPGETVRLSSEHLGTELARDWLHVDEVFFVRKSPATSSNADSSGAVQLDSVAIEEVVARSLKINQAELPGYDELAPRSVSVLPIASGCQAKCSFCFSHSSISHDQAQRRLREPRIRQVLEAGRRLGAERAVITGGGEPSLLPMGELLKLVGLCATYFPDKVVLITNGYFLSTLEEADRRAALLALRDAGLRVLSVSRHAATPVENQAIMKLHIEGERIAETWSQLGDAVRPLRLRWVCVLQRGAVEDMESMIRYVDWVSTTNVSEICFKELYVSTSLESVYHSSDYNQWSLANQVPLSLVLDFVRQHDFAQTDQLPWGSPIFEGQWKGRQIRIAAYTEPPVFWERAEKIARSWNLLADGVVYASLEDKASRVDDLIEQLAVTAKL